MSFEDSASSGYVTVETVYGTHEDSHVVMSEKVQSLAGSIYQEFERLIARYDEDVVKTLMPLLVNVLECLDSAYQTNQVQEVELELLREDNEQLVTQYEREKAARKHAEQKLLEAEDHFEGERKELTGRLESLDSIVRLLELKHKNSLDHAGRLEERENDLKKEYSKLHERYTELFKTHMDYMERTKLLISTSSDRVDARGRLGFNPQRSSGPISFGFASLENACHNIEQTESMPGSPSSLSSSPTSPIDAELRTVEQSHQTDAVSQQNQATSPSNPEAKSSGKSRTKSEKRSGNTLYQELSFHDLDTSAVESEDGENIITGSWVHPGEYASSVNDNYFGMGKEVENLILENNELLATKNALNVVKDDLIVKVDELTGEQEILREEIATLNAAKGKMQTRVTQLEEELKKINETVTANAGEAEEEADVPLAQRRRFTRVEMARVLMERNQYKERLMELQDAVRLTEMVRANRVDSSLDEKNKQSIWKFFSKLFRASEPRPQRPLSTPHFRAVAAPAPAMRHSRTQADFLETQLSDHHHNPQHHYQRRHDRSEQFRQVRAHVRKDDGRTQAYGWSLPGKGSGQKPASPGAPAPQSGVPVPVPVFCRPLAEVERGMELLCATGVIVSKPSIEESCSVADAYFSQGPPDNTSSLAEELNTLDPTNAELQDAELQASSAPSPNKNNSEENASLIWIACSTKTSGIIMIIDANNPADVIESFSIADKHILCIAAVPDASDDRIDDELFVPGDTVLSQSPHKSDIGEGPVVGIKPDNNQENAKSSIGMSRLVKTTILTPPESPVRMPMSTEDPDNKGKLSEDGTDSPPLSSTPVKERIGSPEPGLDAFAQEQSTSDHNADLPSAEPRPQRSARPTVWLGTKAGNLYVHSSVSEYSKCLAMVKLPDAILSIASCCGQCLVALADGTVAIFSRTSSGEWDFSTHWIVGLGDAKCSVRCLASVGYAIWCGYRNAVAVLSPRSRRLLHTIEAHPRRESQVRQIVSAGDAVWISIKMDSNLRLYHAKTYKYLMDVDIEPYVSKMLGTGKLGFSLVRITALLASGSRLWIGTGNGVVVSVPLCAGQATIRDFAASGNVPWCSMAHAQLSFHGHRDAVKFFVAVPGAAGSPARSPESPDRVVGVSAPPMLVLSGGEGYIDFRIAESEMEESSSGSGGASESRLSRSHLIVWQVALSP